MTYYKYQEIESEDVLDWGQIGKNISETIDKIDENREKRRDEIDATYEEFQNKLADAPLGEHKGINNQILDYSSDVQNSATYAHKMLKAGKWNTRQYQQFMQSLSDNSEQLLDVFTTGNTYYDEILQGVQDGSLSGINGFLADQNNSLYKLVDTKWVIDPVTGQTAIAKYKIDENGDKVLDMDNLVSIKDLENRLKKRYDSYDVEGNLKQRADLFAKKFETLSEDKKIRSMDDIRQLTKMGKDGKEVSIYESVVESSINSMLASPMNEQSILYDYLKFDENGEEYVYSNNPEDKGKENVIYFDYDNKTGQPNIELTDNQRAYIKDQLRDRLDSMIGRSLNLPQQFAPQQPNVAYQKWLDEQGDQKTAETNMITNLGKLWYGDEKDLQEALNFFGGLNKNIKEMERSGDEVIITMKDGGTERVPLKDSDGNPLSQEQFIKQATVLSGEMDISKALQRGGYDFTKDKFSEATQKSIIRTEANVYDDARDIVNSQLGNYTAFFAGNEEQGAQKIQAIVGKLGYTATEGGGLYEAVDIKDRDGNLVVQLDFSENAEGAKVQYDKLMNIFENIPEEQLKEIVKAAKTTSGDEGSVDDDDPLGIK